MIGLFHDASFAWRTIWRRPATSLLIITTLALGIGVNTAMFSMTWHVLLAPLPYADGDRLVKLEQQEPGNQREDTAWSVPAIADLRAQNTVFSSVLQYFHESWTLYGSNGSFQVDVGTVNGDFFTTLGLEPAAGRLFTSDDDRAGASPVMVLGYRFWTEQLGGRQDLLGSTLDMNGFTYTVIGILPAIPPYPRDSDVWVTSANDFVMADERIANDRRTGLVSHVIGKLDEGVTVEQARQHLALFAQRQTDSYPDIYPAEAGYMISVQQLKDDINGSSSRTLALLMGLAMLVALLACTNVANITLANITQRTQELAVREVVGAGPATIRRQLITENLVICAIGGLVGLALCAATLGFVSDFASIYTPLATEITLHADVLWFCMVLTLAIGLASAFIACGQTRDINRALKEDGSKATASAASRKTRDILLAAQCTLAFVLLTSTALMASSLYGLVNQPTGYDDDNVVLVAATMRGMDPTAMWPERDMMLQVLEETRALPGVQAAGLSGTPLLQGSGFPPGPMLIEGAAENGTDRRIQQPFTIVSAGFFDVMRIPLLQGRHFANTDDDKAPQVVIVNQAFVDQYLPQRHVLGRRLSMSGGNSWMSIVGVVADIRARDIDAADIAMVYTHYGASPTQRINLYVKTQTDMRDTANAVAAIIQRHDPLQPIDAIVPLEEVKNRWLAPMRLRTALISAFGVLALLVTLSGVVGVVSCNISQRVREIGVHMAIGATPTRVSRLFIMQGVKTCLLGLALGVLLMLALAPLLEPLLYDTAASSAALYLACAIVLMLAIAIALYVPASKASRMSPIAALHAE